MINLDYAVQQLGAVWRMAYTRDRNEDGTGGDWRENLDRSIEGVFRSFWAIIFVAPFAFLGFVGVRRAARYLPDDFETSPLMEAPLSLVAAIEYTAMLVDWGVSILALIVVARTLQTTKTITDTLICYNWTQVYATAFQVVPVAIIGLFGGPQLASVLILPVLVLVLVLYWSLFRRAMGLDAGMTIAVIVMLTLISLITRSAVTFIATAVFFPAAA